MSADNYLITFRRPDAKIEMFDIGASDERLCFDTPMDIRFSYAIIRMAYKRNLVGVFSTEEDMKLAEDNYKCDRVVEYPTVYLHNDHGVAFASNHSLKAVERYVSPSEKNEPRHTFQASYLSY